MLLTIVIPAYHAENQICTLLQSLENQTFQDFKIIISNDDPKGDYSFVHEIFPDLNIKILSCIKNCGPGIARKRGLDLCDTEWVMFCDADDMLFSSTSLESLIAGIEENSMEVAGYFEYPDGQVESLPHVWMFGRIYQVSFLKQYNINFSSLRGMEDAEFNNKIDFALIYDDRVITEIDIPIYLWKSGPESITSIGKVNDIPIYDYSMCATGAVDAAIGVIKYCKQLPISMPLILMRNEFAIDTFIDCYFTWVEACNWRPEYKEQCFFNAKKFYNEIMIDITDFNSLLSKLLIKFKEKQNNDKEFKKLKKPLKPIDFINKVHMDLYGGQEEFNYIRSQIPQELIELERKTGVIE